MKKLLREGMRAGDLEDLVLPLVSVDEFESKIDPDAIVFGFYVCDHDAAKDLNRFVQKSPVSILDTEVSPAPDQRGYYFVFFEVLRSDRLPEIVSTVLDEVSPLARVEDWQIRIRGADGLMPFSEKALVRHLLHKNGEPESRVDEHVLNFLRPSGLSNARAEDGHLVLEGFGYYAAFEIVAFGPEADVASRYLSEGADLGLQDVAKEIRITRMLGEGWTVLRAGGLSFVQYHDNENVLVLRDG